MQFLSARGIGHRTVAGDALAIHVGATTLTGYSKPALEAALTRAGYPTRADPAHRSLGGIFAAVMVMGLLSAMTYGAVRPPSWSSCSRRASATPACRSRTTSARASSAGCLPLISQYIVAKSGDPFGGLWLHLGRGGGSAGEHGVAAAGDARERDIRV